ncbi:hypothetical protein I8J29_24795 [Paenibacillus sp. MWE-103]|uniref:Uncharacterized protein n=1 Tax=Paenibacillus artemisiicola TaxID=1172618 RepID=A0ABS3WGF7_9BACL|nr:hypothetical protein [Paenibacillus artemisiicola]MBO7747409.1 hypothetical protein [Paenibacillus artemisiicola]
MNHCMFCGQPFYDGDAHVCAETSGFDKPARQDGGGWKAAVGAAKRTDYRRMLELLRNPQLAEELEPGRDWIYGAAGLAAAMLGFLLWGWMAGTRIEAMLDGLFGGFAGLADMTGASGAIRSLLTGKLFRLALISLVSLFLALWLAGSWLGARRPPLRALLTVIGGSQYLFAVAFVAAGLLAFADLRISFFILAVALLTALATNVAAGMELAGVPRSRRFAFAGCAIAAYAALMTFLSFPAM